jgi:hypothetical protein
MFSGVRVDGFLFPGFFLSFFKSCLDLEARVTLEHFKLVSDVPPLRGLVFRLDMIPPLPLHFVQGKRGGLRCFVPDGTLAWCAESFPYSWGSAWTGLELGALRIFLPGRTGKGAVWCTLSSLADRPRVGNTALQWMVRFREGNF